MRQRILHALGAWVLAQESYPDPTTDDERWLVVDFAPVVALAEPVTLVTIKGEAALAEMQLLRRSRLSVVPVERSEFNHILKLGKTKITKKGKS